MRIPNRVKETKRDVRAFPAKTSWETTRPLICQAVNRIISALLPWAAWPIFVREGVKKTDYLVTLIKKVGRYLAEITIS